VTPSLTRQQPNHKFKTAKAAAHTPQIFTMKWNHNGNVKNHG
jgi:hypothetical protein